MVENIAVHLQFQAVRLAGVGAVARIYINLSGGGCEHNNRVLAQMKEYFESEFGTILQQDAASKTRAEKRQELILGKPYASFMDALDAQEQLIQAVREKISFRYPGCAVEEIKRSSIGF